MTTVDDALFWDVAEQFLAAGADRSTMMGFPCLRINGSFFASLDHRTGDLIVKLPKERVDQLIGDGIGQPFAPAGRRFKEWVTIPDRDEDLWQHLAGEALDFATA
ncbi:MAG: hypothetical protein R2754_00905 [Microthrixaceae bacterium]